MSTCSYRGIGGHPLGYSEILSHTRPSTEGHAGRCTYIPLLTAAFALETRRKFPAVSQLFHIAGGTTQSYVHRECICVSISNAKMLRDIVGLVPLGSSDRL